MNLFAPCCKPDVVLMHPEEAAALDVLVHFLMPDVIVETGTHRGHSSFFLARHCPVVTMDRESLVEDRFRSPEVTYLLGTSPGDLDLFLEHVRGKRWVFFHDSHHVATCLVAETWWAFSNGAAAVLWHDAGLNELEHPLGGCQEHGGMNEGLRRLQVEGYRAEKVLDMGCPEVNWKPGQPFRYSGIGIAWPKP